MIDLGLISFYLGIIVTRDQIKKKITLLQRAYLIKALKRFGLQKANTSPVPIKHLIELVANQETTSEDDVRRYQSIVSSVMFPIIETRPDIAFAVLTVSRFAHNPTSTHMTAVRLILQYLAGSLDRGITYRGNKNLDLTPIGFSDAD